MRNNIIWIITLLLAACSAVRRPAASASEDAHTAATPPPEEHTPAQKASYYYFEGIRAAGIHDDLPGAEANFRAALQHDSLHAPSNFELSSIYLPVDPARALAYGEKAAALDPENPWFKQQLGRLYVMNRDYAAARRVYDEIVRQTPNDPENYRFLAALYEQTGSPYAALAVLDSAEVRFGFNEEFSTYRRQLLIQTGMIDRAIDEARALTFNSPYDEQNFVALGDLYARTRQDSLALEAYDQALALQPQSVEALMSLSDLYYNRQDETNFLAVVRRIFASDEVPLEEKLTFFNDFIKNPSFYQRHYFAVNDLVSVLAVKYPKEPGAMQLYAQHQINSGQVEEALKTYKSGLAETSDVELYQTIIEIEAYLGHSDSAARYTERALERFPGNMELYFTKSATQSYAKEYDEAIRTLKEASRRAPTDSVRSLLRSTMGDIVHQSDSVNGRRRSFPYYEKALKYDPDNIHALNNYSYFLSLEGQKLEKALAMSARVMELEPGNPTYIDTYGWILYKLGRLDQAKTTLQQAVALDREGSPELMVHYGDVLHALGDGFMASVYWKKAQEKGYDAREIEKRLKLIE